MTPRECPTCGGQGEVPTAATAHLADMTVGGFEHPGMEFAACEACGGTGQIGAPPQRPAVGDEADPWGISDTSTTTAPRFITSTEDTP